MVIQPCRSSRTRSQVPLSMEWAVSGVGVLGERELSRSTPMESHKVCCTFHMLKSFHPGTRFSKPSNSLPVPGTTREKDAHTGDHLELVEQNYCMFRLGHLLVGTPYDNDNLRSVLNFLSYSTLTDYGMYSLQRGSCAKHIAVIIIHVSLV